MIEWLNKFKTEYINLFPQEEEIDHFNDDDPFNFIQHREEHPLIQDYSEQLRITQDTTSTYSSTYEACYNGPPPTRKPKHVIFSSYEDTVKKSQKSHGMNTSTKQRENGEYHSNNSDRTNSTVTNTASSVTQSEGVGREAIDRLKKSMDAMTKQLHEIENKLNEHHSINECIMMKI